MVAKRTGTRAATRKRAPKARGTRTNAGARKRTPTTKRTANTKRGAKARNASARQPRKTARRPQASPRPTRIASATTAVKGAVAGAVSAVSRVLRGGPAETDAIALLEADHRRMEALLAQGEDTTERAVGSRTELLNTLTTELNLHELIEEEVLYPALKAHPEAREIVLEGYQEHHVADLIVKELHDVAKDDERWGAKFKVLKENIEHHIEEEEGEMFRTARAVLSADELQALGARMAALKARRQ